MKIKSILLATAVLGMTAAAWAQDKPGIDRPIRVAMFRGTGTGGQTYWHTNIHTSHTVMANMLANPAGSNLGDSLDIPPAGFTFYTIQTQNNCAANGCGPAPADIVTWIQYLTDSADVMVLSSVVDFGSRVTDATQRQAIADFWTTKGYVGIHAISDSKSRWAPLDSIHGTRFNNHPAEQSARIRIDSVFKDDPSWQYLNRGVFSNGEDTTFHEEWFFYTNSGVQIRARPYLKPTLKLIEQGMTGINNIAMGTDHPHTWFRELPTGGRVFYTGMGHRSQVWQGTRAFRRHIYNSILWTAKYDSLKNISSAINPGAKTPAKAADYSRLSVAPGALTVTMLPAGNHTVELLGLDGRRVAIQQGAGAEKAYNFTGLRAGVYAVNVSTVQGRSSRLVTIQ